MENTDPRRSFVERFGGLFDFTTYRTQYYDVPNQSVQAAKQRNAWVRTPLRVSASPFGR